MCKRRIIKPSMWACYSLYILFFVVSINYAFSESKHISANATEHFEDDISEDKRKIVNNAKLDAKNASIEKSTSKRRENHAVATHELPEPKQGLPIASTTIEIQETDTVVWCYCNLASCVPNNYMCKSLIGACYSKSIEQTTRVLHASQIPSTYFDGSANFITRGCVEFLPKIERRKCVLKLDPLENAERKFKLLNVSKDGEADVAHSYNAIDDDDLQCCNQDVCNYEVSPPVFVIRKSDESHSSTMSDRFEWFRSATIAVSVAGLLILIILIFFASRMIAADTKSIAYRHQVSCDLRSKGSYLPDRTLATSESGSILCANSLQRNGLPSLCGLHPPKSSERRSYQSQTNRYSFPRAASSVSSCSTIDTSLHVSVARTCDFGFASPEETEPLNNVQSRDSNHFLLDTSFPT